jgi:hypothetical protein
MTHDKPIADAARAIRALHLEYSRNGVDDWLDMEVMTDLAATALAPTLAEIDRLQTVIYGEPKP